MKGVSFLIILGIISGWGAAEFLNNRPFPTYSLESMPDTDFTCRDKILGGYYADAQTQCQMFHICVKVSGVGVQDFRFLCPNGTAFDQDHQICAEWDDVDCDATTLYYASDNFDLYRLGSGFESKALKYGEEEEPFSLQRAETGDIRLNREHQSNQVNQKKEFNFPSKTRKVDNSERDIFKVSSSSNFFNNRNGGKEVDDDEDDDNYNVNQNRDSVQKKKLVRKQQRRPEQNINQEDTYQQPKPQKQPQRVQQQEIQRVQQQEPQRVKQQQPQKQQHQEPQRVQQQEPQRVQQQEPQRVHQQEPQRIQPKRIQQQQPQRIQQNQEPQRIPQQQTQHPQQLRPQVPEQTDILKQQNNEQTPRPNRPTNFINNFAGSNPTTPRATETTINNEQYSTAINNFRTRNVNRRPVINKQYNEADSFRQSTLSTPAPFKQTQFHKATTYDDGQYRPTTARPKLNGETENYPPPFNKQNFQSTPQKPSPFKPQQQTTFTQQKKVKQDSYPTTPIIKNSGFDNQYDVPKIKPAIKQALPQKQNDNNYPTTFAPNKLQKAFVNQKQNDNFVPTTFSPRINLNYKQTTPQNTQNTQQSYNKNTQQYNQNTQQFNQNNQQYNQNNNQKYNNQDTQQYNNQNQEQLNSQKPVQNGNSQDVQYNHPGHNRPFVNQFSQKQTTQFSETQPSTPKSTPFTHYTPTVPKVTSTTPVSRSNRFDETLYDDGSYDSRYDSYDNGNPANREEEFLKAEHSQNIASSRNELLKNARKAAAITTTTQRPYYSESPRPFSQNVNPSRVTDYPKTTKQVNEKKQPPPRQQNEQAQEPVKEQKKQTKSEKVEKNVSYDYAYYDTNVGSDPDYEIDTDFKKTTPQ